MTSFIFYTVSCSDLTTFKWEKGFLDAHTAEKGFRSVRRTIVQIRLNVDLRKSLRHTHVYHGLSRNYIKDVWKMSFVQVSLAEHFKTAILIHFL